jgi:type II secretory pathway component PulK
VLVLWLTLVLSLTAVSVTRVARGDLRIAFNLEQAAMAEALADGGFYLGLAALMKQQSADPWPIDGEEREFVIAGERVFVSIRDEGAKLDINTAPGELLEQALLSAGMEVLEASDIADAILAQRLAYQQAVAAGQRTSALIRAARFSTIRELQSVAALDRAGYASLRDLFTVYTARRLTGGVTRPMIRPPALSPVRGVPDGAQPHSRVNTYAIHSRVSLASGAGFARYAVVRLKGGRRSGHQVLHWD